MQISVMISFILVYLSFPLLAKTEVRRIYLNGIDISSAKHQQLERVNLRIDGQGNIFIEAPHYSVTEESSYIPLSSLSTEAASRPRHNNKSELPRQLGIVEPIEPLQGLMKQAKPIGNLSNPDLNGEQ